VPARIQRSHPIIIGRCRRPPIICIGGRIGRQNNTVDERKVDAVGRPLNPKTTLVICIVSPGESNLGG
jgi:hypothetical protein